MQPRGYYTLPILYRDRLVVRLDPRVDRATATLNINGFWLEDHAPHLQFVHALAHGLIRFADLLDARHVNLAVAEPASLWVEMQTLLGDGLEIQG